MTQTGLWSSLHDYGYDYGAVVTFVVYDGTC